MSDRRNGEFLAVVAQLGLKCGRELLTENDLLLLACEEISRTTTYEELQYHSGPPCTE